MQITYTAQDGSVEAVSTADLSAKEAADIESCTGMEWLELEEALRRQSPTAMRAVLWASRRRQQTGLRFSEFDVPQWQRRLKARLEYEEILEVVDNIRRETPDEEQIALALRYARRIASDQGDVDKALAETDPKAAAPVVVAPEESAA